MPQLSLLVLRGSNLTANLAFYRALGFDFKAEKHGDGLEHFACENEGFVFELYPAPESSDARTRLGFRVLSLEEAAANLHTVGVHSELQDSPWGSRLITRDPDGRTVELSE